MNKTLTDAVTIPRALLQDLIDDVADYAASREFRANETAWRDDILARARAILAAQQPEPLTFEAKHISLKQKGAKLILTLELDGVEGAPRYTVRPINPSVVRPQPEPRAEVTDEQPSLTNPLTPYGMLVRALRIVSGTTLMDMAQHLGRGPAELSSIEFGRKPVRDADIVDAAHFFGCVGIQSTTHALTIAARAGEGQ